MVNSRALLFGFGLLFSSLTALAVTQPDWSRTPGVLCTVHDPDFDGFRYPAKIAHCGRSVSAAEKRRVAQIYGIPQSQWNNYEFDHLIPLNAGGSNDIGNIWPQPILEAKQKDVVEQKVFNGLSAGTMTQAQALQLIRAWFNQPNAVRLRLER